jgi:hypothetical protein
LGGGGERGRGRGEGGRLSASVCAPYVPQTLILATHLIKLWTIIIITNMINVILRSTFNDIALSQTHWINNGMFSNFTPFQVKKVLMLRPMYVYIATLRN